MCVSYRLASGKQTKSISVICEHLMFLENNEQKPLKTQEDGMLYQGEEESSIAVGL